MGLLTDAFLADLDEASIMDLNRAPDGPSPVYPGKSLDPVKLGTLEEIITGTPLDQIVGDLVTDHFESESGEVGVHDVRPSLVQALASLANEDVLRIAAKWAATEEWEAEEQPARTSRQ